VLARAPAAPAESFPAGTNHVADGDTVTSAERLTIRLNGIDAPDGDQPYATEAKKSLTDTVEKRTLRVVRCATDKYRRTVANVYLPDASRLCYKSLKYGFTWRFRKYSANKELGRMEKEV